MAAKRSFDFGKLTRSFMTTKIKSGKTLVVNMPRKSTFEKMTALQNMDDEEVTNAEAYEGIVELMVEILNNNKGKEEVMYDEIATDYDLEEMIAYIKGYAEFVQTLQQDPN